MTPALVLSESLWPLFYLLIVPALFVALQIGLWLGERWYYRPGAAPDQLVKALHAIAEAGPKPTRRERNFYRRAA